MGQRVHLADQQHLGSSRAQQAHAVFRRVAASRPMLTKEAVGTQRAAVASGFFKENRSVGVVDTFIFGSRHGAIKLATIYGEPPTSCARRRPAASRQAHPVDVRLGYARGVFAACDSRCPASFPTEGSFELFRRLPSSLALIVVSSVIYGLGYFILWSLGLLG